MIVFGAKVAKWPIPSVFFHFLPLKCVFSENSCIFVPLIGSNNEMKDRLAYLWVWLRRIGNCRGFGIQSPADYAFVRYVVNEHWPYYQYRELAEDDDWLTQRLGRLYFRLANWRQPATVISNGYRKYWQAGCHRTQVVADASRVELAHVCVGERCRTQLEHIYNKVDDRSVLVIEGISRDRGLWQQVVADPRTGVAFDLYYCGIVMFDKKRTKQNYIINF